MQGVGLGKAVSRRAVGTAGRPELRERWDSADRRRGGVGVAVWGWTRWSSRVSPNSGYPETLPLTQLSLPQSPAVPSLPQTLQTALTDASVLGLCYSDWAQFLLLPLHSDP